MKLLQDKYILLLNLPKITKREDKYNFRCVICGDSKKSSKKKRGWLLWNKNYNTYIYHCFNCGYDTNFDIFLKSYNPELFKQYQYEKLKEFGNKSVKEEKEEQTYIKYERIDLPLAITNNEAYQYLKQRKIPEKYHTKLYYTDNFYAFLKKTFKKECRIPKSDKRIVIPFYNTDKEITYIQGRALENQYPKYLSHKIKEPVLFNLDEIDFNKEIYVTEGPFDAMFLPNCISSASMVMMNKVDKLLNLPPEQFILVFDNEYKKNPEIVKIIEKSILKGYCIGFWNNIKEKDINEMIINNIEPLKHLEVLSGRFALIKLKMISN